MCGIYGWFSRDFQAATSNCTEFHRGPDDFGSESFQSQKVKLNHWRLSIIDLSSDGHQPILSEDGRFAMVFNGEIYNYPELREELKTQGISCKTKTDTEVLLKVYLTYGIDGVQKLNGIFSFIIWDNAEKQLIAARDRFGVKPLYWSQINGVLQVASEIKQLTQKQNRANLARCLDYLESGITDHTDETLFDGIYQLRGGHFFSASEANNYVPRIQVWPNSSEILEETNFENSFKSAIDLQLRSDVPVGACLSGGLDSTAIVCMVRELQPEIPLNTFTAIFPGMPIDEGPVAKATAMQLGTIHHEVHVSPSDLLQNLEKITWLHDEPTGSSSMLAQYLVMKSAKDNEIKVMLDGQGADEIFGGYISTFPYYNAELGNNSVLHNQRRQAILHLGLPNSLKVLAQKIISIHRVTGTNWLAQEILHVRPPGETAWKRALQTINQSEPNSVKEFLKAMTYSVSLPMLLHSEDRNSMGHSIEARVPFLENNLANFGLQLSTEQRMNSEYTKLPIREYLRTRISKDVYDNKKKLGFATPEEIWFRSYIRKEITTLYIDAINENKNIVDALGAQSHFQQKMDGKSQWDFSIWRLISFNLWRKKYNVTF